MIYVEEIITVLNESLNYWYPSKREDGEDACAARKRLLELRDKLERERLLGVLKKCGQ